MTKEQLKEWAETIGISIEEAEQLQKRGEEARKKDNRFEAKNGEGLIIDGKHKRRSHYKQH